MQNVAELAIYHILYDLPSGSTHITPDGKKFYFILNRKLVRVEAQPGDDFRSMDEEELTQHASNYLASR